MREGKLEDMAKLIPDGLIEAVSIVCPPAEVGKQLRERYDGVLDRVSLYLAMSGDSTFNRWHELVAAVHAA